jgi:L-rhamnonate dehydratase
VMWIGGLTEALRVSAMAAAYDIPVVPHASGAYSYHFVISQPHIPFSEYVNMSADGRSIEPVFGALFQGEDLPQDGKVTLADRPGFGLTLRDGLDLQRPFAAS